MPNFYILKKHKLNAFLKAAMSDFSIVGPEEANNGDYLLQEIKDPGKLNLNYDITSNTLKEFFFPRRETIFNYEQKPGALTRIIPAKDAGGKPIIFFGVRSCDIRAVYFQDRFFGKPPTDILYRRKRDRSILVSFACNRPPRRSCFCIHTKSGPFLDEGGGFDLQFMELASDYLIEAGSKKGVALLKRYWKFFIPADKDAPDRKSSLREACAKEFKQKYDLLKTRRKLKTADLRELWKALGKRCTNCGGCEFICPTCFCFYQQDVKTSEHKGEKIRAWDSCTFAGYNRMAGDNTPHEKNSERISRRFFCKIYNSYGWFSVFGCTGCGRCSFVCPVNLDMESLINSLKAGGVYKPLLNEL